MTDKTTMNKSTILVWILYYIQAVSAYNIIVCMDSAVHNRPSVIYCTCNFNEAVCLVCPKPKNILNLTWNKEKETRPLYSSHYRSLRINECDENRYSLMIPHFDVENKEGKYICKQQNIALATFVVQIRGKVVNISTAAWLLVNVL